MIHLKKLTMTLALAFTGVLASWAQDEVTLTPTATANEWTLEMPDADVELEVTYYTAEELAAEEEAAFTAGVELTKASNGEWTLAEMPGFDIELEVEYETALALNEVDDNTATLAEWNGYEADVTLTRTLSDASWNTFAAPFSMAIPAGWTVKELESATLESSTLTLNFRNAASLVAGNPYLVKVTADADLSAAAYTGVIVSSAAVPTTTEVVDFIPTLGKTTIKDVDATSVLFLAAGNKLKNPDTMPTDMKGFRAYFQLKGAGAGARSFSLNLGDESTGIVSMHNSECIMHNDVYDLQGRKVNALPNSQFSIHNSQLKKGVYIVNGKKVIIK